MRTNSKAVRHQIRKHILECVYDYNENTFNDINSACNHLYSEFCRVANHPYNIKNIPNEQERFSDYLNGLPFSFIFVNDAITDFLNSLGINPNNKKYDIDKNLKLYHYLIYSEMIKNKNI